MAKNRYKSMTDQQLRAALKQQTRHRPGQARVVSATEKAIKRVIQSRKSNGTWTGGKSTGKGGSAGVPKENRREPKAVPRSPTLGQPANRGPSGGGGGGDSGGDAAPTVPGESGPVPTAPGVPTGFDPYANAQVSEFIRNLRAPQFNDPTKYPGNPGGPYVPQVSNPHEGMQSAPQVQAAGLNQIQSQGMPQNLQQLPSLGQPMLNMQPIKEKKGFIPSTGGGNIRQPNIDPNKKMPGQGGGLVGIEPKDILYGGGQGGGGQPPTGGGPMGADPLQSSLNMFEELFRQNTQGSLQNFNRASNRLRDRLESMGAGAADAARNAALSRGGFGLQSGLQNARQATQEAYGQGLVGLESEFEKNRLQGLQQALGAAGGLQNEADFARNLAQRQSEFGANFGLDQAKLSQLDQQQQAALRLQQYLAEMQNATQRYGIEQGVNSGAMGDLQNLLAQLLAGQGGGAGGSGGYQSSPA